MEAVLNEHRIWTPWPITHALGSPARSEAVMPMTTILIAEDDPTIVEVLRDALEGEGYDVASAVGPAAIDIAIEVKPAVALVDLNMPGMDGIEICRRLRTDDRTRGIRLVLMSAAYRLRARQDEINADMMLAKPFDLNRLLTLVDDLVERTDD